MKTNLEEVRAAIVKAVPEIHQKYKDSFYIPVRNGAGKGAYSEAEDYVNQNPSFTPLRLADILRAIPGNSIGLQKSVSNGGNRAWFITDIKELKHNATGISWNLALDNLDDQSAETLAFIHKILCV